MLCLLPVGLSYDKGQYDAVKRAQASYLTYLGLTPVCHLFSHVNWVSYETLPTLHFKFVE